jgi:hypothetical protein
MTRSLARAAAACAAALILAGAAALPANAYYLGYGNGDPGNWDLWTEQNGGRNPEMQAQTRTTYSAREPRAHHARGEQHAHHMSKPHDSFGSKTY